MCIITTPSPIFPVASFSPWRGQDELLLYAVRVALPASTSVFAFIRGYSTGLAPVSKNVFILPFRYQLDTGCQIRGIAIAPHLLLG